MADCSKSFWRYASFDDMNIRHEFGYVEVIEACLRKQNLPLFLRSLFATVFADSKQKLWGRKQADGQNTRMILLFSPRGEGASARGTETNISPIGTLRVGAGTCCAYVGEGHKNDASWPRMSALGAAAIHPNTPTSTKGVHPVEHLGHPFATALTMDR
ncbi:hypothetical protein HPP92_025132 [Vanilla planifolia]|uniref:Uncharacterized protein n=1 Tax=Vanilla planifolia TaxID=51239 RepID=A0A835PM34_VANPL|nr:hypothetical protein HPP92_025132 [Vanilla planifolia]